MKKFLAFWAVSLSLAVAVVVSANAATPPVFIEDLTWVELRDRVAGGAVIALVPTGATEASGPHLALGKHSFVIRDLAGRIAIALGNALVAPVIPIVPEGSMDKPAGNFDYPGTLGLSEGTFANVLRETVAGLARSGFKTIAFLGDHGQSQPVQTLVAEELDAQWRARGVRVFNVASFYDPAGQDRWLEQNGVAPAALGDHAGVADTAQLMASRPGAVRRDRLSQDTWTEKSPSGATGRPDRATPEMGMALLQQRVDAAVAEIRRHVR